MAKAVIANLHNHTTVDERTGATHSVQAADLVLSERDVRALWSPENLERLARTYWRFLTRVTLGLVRVRYTDTERFVVLLFRPLTLLAFSAPEYELAPNHGVVRWCIERGVLVARAGRGSKGHLQIDVRRLPDTSATPDAAGEGAHGAGDTAGGHASDTGGGTFQAGGDTSDAGGRASHAGRDASASDAGGRSINARLRVEVEVANFHPAIASGISRRVYNATQARIHSFVTNGFLRSLARLDLARSRVGRLAAATQTEHRRTTPAAWRGRGGR